MAKHDMIRTVFRGKCMENIILLGTGNATVTKCYNTCFALQHKNEYIVVDAGGGNGILQQLKKADIAIENIREMIITHCHTDHILGAIWIYRMIATAMKNGNYIGQFTIYCHDEAKFALETMIKLTIQDKFVQLLNEKIFIKEVTDKEIVTILEYDVTFFDILSTKAKQFGFTIKYGNKKLTCLGDEPCNPASYQYVQDSDWLLAEAFCLYRDRDIFKPYQKHHSTVKEASELAESLKVKNLVLYHTEEKNLEQRKLMYTKEARQYFKGNIYVPDDLEKIRL